MIVEGCVAMRCVSCGDLKREVERPGSGVFIPQQEGIKAINAQP